MENKLHKIGQTEQTIFLNSQKNNRDYYSKEGLGFQNPCKLDLPCKFGIRDLLVTNHAEHESERMKKHDGKFTTINFCYDYTNTTYFSNPNQRCSKDFYMP